MDEEKAAPMEAEVMKDLVIINRKNKLYGRKQKTSRQRNKKAGS